MQYVNCLGNLKYKSIKLIVKLGEEGSKEGIAESIMDLGECIGHMLPLIGISQEDIIEGINRKYGFGEMEGCNCDTETVGNI